MKNYAYNVNTHGENDEATFRTNDVRDVLDSLLKAKAQGIHCDLLDGFTGEVLAIVNSPDCEDYATDEVVLMIRGMMFEALEGEDAAPEAEENDPVCGECGGPVNANGACQHCGVVDDSLRADSVAPKPMKPGVPVCAVRCDAVPDDLLEFLEQMVAEGKAVKLGGLPS